MKLYICDSEPFSNSYVSHMYFRPMLDYAIDNGMPIECVTNLHTVKDGIVIIGSDHLNPANIISLKNNGCKIIGFNCTDSSYIAQACRYEPELQLIDKMFMLSGIQTHNYDVDPVFDENFNVTLVQKQFLPENHWQNFEAFRPKMNSLPYVLWENPAVPPKVNFSERRKSIIFRGGNHFLRVLTYLFALRNKVADQDSGFSAYPYFEDSMNPQFRFCDECRSKWKPGQYYPYQPNPQRADCTSIAEWGGKLNLQNPGHWNNRCPKSFYWLAEQFQKTHGPLEMGKFQTAINGRFWDYKRHLETLRNAMFFADYKWVFSINTPQRFWEAAMARTIYLVPDRTKFQDYFPAIQKDEHYMTFSEDFGGLDAEVSEEKFNHITDNCSKMHTEWMSPSQYKISTNLLKHIFERIEE